MARSTLGDLRELCVLLSWGYVIVGRACIFKVATCALLIDGSCIDPKLQLVSDDCGATTGELHDHIQSTPNSAYCRELPLTWISRQQCWIFYAWNLSRGAFLTNP